MASRAATTVDRTTWARVVPWLVVAAAGLLAFVVRWRAVGGSTGLRGYHGYDDGVYFSSAIALTYGHLPYRDFLLLHPPGIMLALTPFAALARWTGDSTAFAAARVGFILVGAVNTVLVARIARRWGVVAAVVAGGLYAVSSAAAGSEDTTRLEPLGTLTLLAGVSILLRSRARGTSALLPYAAGAVLGLGLVVKIWNVVPVLVVLVWQAYGRGLRSAARVAAGAAVSALVVVVPFALHDPGRMLRLVVLDQLGRPRTAATLVTRLDGILAVHRLPVPRATQDRVMVAVAAAVTVAAVACLVRRRGRLWVALLVAEVVVLLASPSYFDSYAELSAASVPLVLAAGVSLTPRRATPWIAAATCLTVGLATGLTPTPTQSFAVDRVRAILPQHGCIVSDSPGALAILGVLSRDEARDCNTRVDVSGQTYDVGNRDPHGLRLPRVDNQRWQHDAVTYLTSGSATVLARGTSDGFDPATVRRLRTGREDVRVGSVTVLMRSSAGPDAGTG